MPPARSQTLTRLFTFPHVFVAMSLGFGLAMMIVTPPFEVPDEPHHLMRAYQISQGYLLPTFHNNTGGAFLPNSFNQIALPFDTNLRNGVPISSEEIYKALQIPLAPDQTRYYHFSNTSAYSPLVYLPQVLAILIGHAVGLTALQLLYAARIANLLLWTITGYLALSLAPGIRRAIFLLMLMPMSMYLAASASADVVGNSLIIIFCILVWRHIAENPTDTKISSRRAWLLALLAAGIGLAKFVYVPITLLPALIPAASFGGRYRKIVIVAGVFSAAVITSVWWSSRTPGLDMIANGNSKDFYPRLQLEYLRQHPAMWFTVPIQTIKLHGEEQIISFVGKFGWMDTPISNTASYLYCLAFLLACSPMPADRPLAPLWKWILLVPAISVSSISILWLTAYLYWNPKGSPSIVGLQGRYFIPIAPICIMWINCLWGRLPPAFRIKWKTVGLEFCCVVITSIALIYAMHVIYLRYYVA